ncbi:MAG: hypothetical protein PHV51_10145, partial [Methanosarcinaceae archaeon]|nr:hypothetical protein [Methanosarcinaceae archaeon]
HTCRSGTILIKNKNDPFGVPFDVSHSRYIEYEDSIEGLTTLSKNLARNFELLDQNPNYTDNHVLEFANFTKYKFLKFDDEEEIKKNKKDSFANVLVKLLGHPKLISVLTNKSLTEDQRNSQIIKELAKSPEDAIELIKYSIDSGDLKP